MKNIFISLFFGFSFNLLASTPFDGNISPIVDVKSDIFLVYYKDYETKKITLQTYSKDGKLIKSSPLKATPWQNFDFYNRTRRETSISGGKFYTKKYPFSVAILPEKEIKGMSYREKESLGKSANKTINLASMLPEKLKIKSMSYIFVDKNLLFTTCWLKTSKPMDRFFLIFDIQKKSLQQFFLIGNVDISLVGGCKISRIMKYGNGYMIIWKEMPLENLDDNPDVITPLYLSYIDLQKQRISKYVIEDKASIPIEISTGIIGNILCVAYTQINEKEISEVKTTFIDLKKLLKQKPVLVNGPEEIEKIETIPQK